MTHYKIFIRLLSIILLMWLTSCGTVRDDLMKTGWGESAIRTYDKAANMISSGDNASAKEISEFIDEADEAWLKQKLGSMGILDKPSAGRSAGAISPANVVYGGVFRWPVEAEDNVALTSQYGPRWGKKHRGIDLGAPSGTPVYAAAGGKVLFAQDGKNGYGKLVILRHGASTTTYYAHNSQLKVREGSVVKQGEEIASVGSTGRSTGAHLHFEIREGRQAVNPCVNLPKHKEFKCSRRSYTSPISGKQR